MSIEKLCINTLRFLSIDAVEKAKSGHPGAPMGMAAFAYVLWQEHLKHNPDDPSWIDRDRFILSAGHASALLYSLLHVYGYPVTLDEIKRFRQLGSITPGHPERDELSGIETTTGPLGQGLANAVGMAMAERWLAGHYNQPGFDIIDHFTYVVASDGDMMEGVASEACSLAGTLGLGRLICLYDDNNISIEGSTDLAFTENVPERFRAYGWQVIGPIDGLNTREVDAALRQARQETGKPSLIVCSTLIGYGSPNKAGTASAHGEPLGQEETRLTREKLGWQYEPFTVPDEALDHFHKAKASGTKAQQQWKTVFKEYSGIYPQLAKEFVAGMKGELPENWDKELGLLPPLPEKPMATRESSGIALNALAKCINYLVGGSGDLAPSNKTILKDKGHYSAKDQTGHNLHFGVREHAMGAIAAGLSLHGGIIPYVATFLIFYDYMRPAVRLAAMMGIRVIYIFTHDSIGLGEDGPTHQPVEQLMGLRLVPNLVTIRPADYAETLEAWKIAVRRNEGPTALVLTRQKVSSLDKQKTGKDGREVSRGAYILRESDPDPELILIASGSEVHIAASAAKSLKEQGIKVRVVSMPSWELFECQDAKYRNLVLPPEITARISVEAGRNLGWQKYTGDKGIAIGVDGFGVSAPWEDAYKHMGLTAENVVVNALRLLGRA